MRQSSVTRMPLHIIASALTLISFSYLAAGCASSRGAATDGVQPTWTSIQAEVFDKNCATSGCHDGITKRGDLNLEPSASYASLVGVSPKNRSTEGGDLKRVVPGNPDKSFLLIKLVGPNPTQGKRMPLGNQPPLDEVTIQAIRTWIANGAKED